MEWFKAEAAGCTTRQRLDGAGTPVVELTGEVDVAGALELQQTLHAVLEEHGRLTVDLGGLTFIDSSGVRVLAQVGQTAAGRGWGFDVRGATGEVARVLRLASLVAPVLRWGQLAQ